jgi:hypothetical protein
LLGLSKTKSPENFLLTFSSNHYLREIGNFMLEAGGKMSDFHPIISNFNNHPLNNYNQSVQAKDFLNSSHLVIKTRKNYINLASHK